jgi:hypothetical protein
MTRRRILFGLLLASAVLACGVGWLWVASRPRLTVARFKQVKEGMSREEVIRTVGRPPGDYSNGLCITPATGLRFWHHAQWLCDDAELAVRFDGAEKATEVVVLDVVNLGPPTFTERIRRWLGW